MSICTDFYRSLYFDSNNNIQPTDYCYSDFDIPLVTQQEVSTAIKSLKYNKSPGNDGVTTEALKLGKLSLRPHLTNLFNTMLRTGKVPLTFCHSNIILLHKKGDRKDINNYRPISLISNIYTIFIKIILTRITQELDSHQPPEQAGFRTKFSTTDHMQAVNQIIQKVSEFNKELYIAFVDYTKAFDNLTHNSIFSALSQQNIHPTYIKLLQIIYNHSTANVKLQSLGPSFSILKGVKQGDPLSPKLFTSALQKVFKNLESSWTTKGIDVGGIRLTNLRFADDIVLFADTSAELEIMLKDLSAASLEIGLKMNRSKTKVMTNSTQDMITVDGELIEYVDEYIYLGQIVSFQDRQGKEVERRIQNAWKSFWSMKAYIF